MKTIRTLIFTFFIIVGLMAKDQPELLKFDIENLETTKTLIRQKDESVYPAYQYLLKIADEALREGPWSVMSKPEVPPSGDMHDYMSLSPYWWPDPEKSDGLPYIRRDGEVNPEREKFDKRAFVHVHENSSYLSLAYYLSGDKKYAKKAAKLIKVWFLEEKTRMNPNMNFGQGVRGRKPGRGVGLIEMKNLIDVLDAITLIQDSKYWSENDQNEMEAWLREYLNWLQTSPIAKEEQAHRNNHGSWFDVQYSHIAYYLGENEEAIKILTDFPEKRIAYQVKPDGSQHEELVRTRAFTYSLFNLRAHMMAARLAKKLNIDIVNYESPNNASIKKEIEFLIPYALDHEKWPYQQITSWEKGYNDMFQILSAANYELDEDYSGIIQKLPGKERKHSIFNLIYPPKK